MVVVVVAVGVGVGVVVVAGSGVVFDTFKCLMDKMEVEFGYGDADAG